MIEPTRPKLMFVGDPHGDFSVALWAVEELAPEATIFLGDLQSSRPLQVALAPILELTEVWFIHGNHDTDTESDHDNLFESELAARNLHGRVVDIGGVRVAGLGGVFRGNVWAPPLAPVYADQEGFLKSLRPNARWRGGLPLRHRSTIFFEDFDRLSRQRADVLVTHEAPGGHRHGWMAIDSLAVAMDAKLLVHGHHHTQIDYLEEGLLPAGSNYLVYGVGRESVLVWPGFAAPGEFGGGDA